MCVQAATGNINSCFLCVDESKRSFVISCGIVLAALDDNNPDTQANELYPKDMDKFE